jgi:proteasome lid subunit RPN8/RPN11
MNTLLSRLILSPEQWSQIVGDVTSRLQEEACGFLAGVGGRVGLVIPVANMLHDPYRFRMDPKEELLAFQRIEEKGMEVLAIYHSHPNGIQRPSATDFAELTFSGIIYLILYQEDQVWQGRAYLMQRQGEAGEVPVIISKIG